MSYSSNPMNKWRLDLGSGSRTMLTRTSDPNRNPPGYIASFVASQKVEPTSRNDHNQQQHLLSKRAWDMALQPMKSLPMNMFMMYMAGNTISIFPIMMIVMMAWRPMKAIMAVNAAFKPLQEYNGSLLVHKIIFALGNMGAIALAVYKCHSMGLLPNHASDWLDFVAPPERMQYVIFSGV